MYLRVNECDRLKNHEKGNLRWCPRCMAYFPFDSIRRRLAGCPRCGYGERLSHILESNLAERE